MMQDRALLPPKLAGRHSSNFYLLTWCTVNYDPMEPRTRLLLSPLSTDVNLCRLLNATVRRVQ